MFPKCGKCSERIDNCKCENMTLNTFYKKVDLLALHIIRSNGRKDNELLELEQKMIKNDYSHKTRFCVQCGNPLSTYSSFYVHKKCEKDYFNSLRLKDDAYGDYCSITGERRRFYKNKNI